MLSLGHVDAASPMRSKGDGAKSLGIASLLATQILAMKEEAGLWDERKLQNAFLQTLEMDQDTERHGDLEVPEVPEDDDHGKMVQHRYDRMMFLKRDQAGLLQVILIVHVDDFLVAHREDYDLEEIKAAFTWGSQTALNPDNEIVFRGKEIRMAKKGSVTTLQVTQKAFIKEIDDAPTIKKKEHTSLTPSEWQEFRSVTGSLQWLAGQTRPDAAAITSLSNKGRETTTKELSELYEFIKVVKLTESLGLSYYPVPWNRATTIVGYSDSSWANAPGHKSQMGVLVMVTSPECTQKKCPASVLDWKSTRSPRVTRSTLASEANAMDERADRCVFTNYFMTHLLWPEVANDQLKMSHLQATDCRSLYDAVISPAPSLTEKRTIVTVMSIQDYLKEEQGTPYILAQPAREQRRVRLSSSDIETEPALELLIQRTSPAAPGSSGSHRPDGTTSHLVPASKDVSNQHLVAAARRRQQLRQDKGFEAELDHRRPEELQRRPDGMMAFARGGRDAAQAQKPLQLMGVNLTQPTSPAAPPPPSSTSGRVSELTQLAVQAALEKLEEEQPTSPKKENMTRSKAFTVRKRQVDMLAIAARMRASSKNNHQGDERSDVSVPPGVPHEPSELEIEIVAHQDHGEHDKYEIHHPAALERHRPHELDSLEDVEDVGCLYVEPRGRRTGCLVG
eukprot:g32450.t1